MNTRYLAKRTLKNIFLMLMLPLYLFYRAISLIGNQDSAFQSCSQTLSLIPGKIGVYTRAAFYRLSCPGTSDDISVGFLTVFSHWDTTIKEGVYIGPQCNIGSCEIGPNTLLGSGVHVLSGKNQHVFSDLNKPIKQQGGDYTKVKIQGDCWIGNSSIVMTDLPQRVVVAAGSIVITSPGSKSVIAGNPAKTIKNQI
jgi:acetyltransferase-like isoleucine patch superfamily enzyme